MTLTATTLSDDEERRMEEEEDENDFNSAADTSRAYDILDDAISVLDGILQQQPQLPILNSTLPSLPNCRPIPVTRRKGSRVNPVNR